MISSIGRFTARSKLSLPCFLDRVPAGFPSPAEEHIDKALDLNEYLIRHPAATFFCRVTGQSMTGIGIYDGDLLIVDRALQPAHGDVVLVALDGELTCKLLDKHKSRLMSANKDYPPIPIGEEAQLIIEGVIVCSIKQHRYTRS